MLDLYMLTIGRHFRLNPGSKMIVGRNQVENERIRILARPGSALFHPVGFKGPTALARGMLGPPAEQMVGEMIASYSQEEKNEYVIQKQIVAGMELTYAVEKKFPKEKLDTLRLG
jgi:hypothetical protein